MLYAYAMRALYCTYCVLNVYDRKCTGINKFVGGCLSSQIGRTYGWNISLILSAIRCVADFMFLKFPNEKSAFYCLQANVFT